mmetsp:Transcript_21570/g.59937  ORF Transcript_21570/g.59937 Transcript_21570/m.59937 type:complete len:227 (+) Transcript_21570:716-1396(+)
MRRRQCRRIAAGFHCHRCDCESECPPQNALCPRLAHADRVGIPAPVGNPRGKIFQAPPRRSVVPISPDYPDHWPAPGTGGLDHCAGQFQRLFGLRSDQLSPRRLRHDRYDPGIAPAPQCLLPAPSSRGGRSKIEGTNHLGGRAQNVRVGGGGPGRAHDRIGNQEPPRSRRPNQFPDWLWGRMHRWPSPAIGGTVLRQDHLHEHSRHQRTPRIEIRTRKRASLGDEA